jgi:hypothetical protein
MMLEPHLPVKAWGILVLIESQYYSVFVILSIDNLLMDTLPYQNGIGLVNLQLL